MLSVPTTDTAPETRATWLQFWRTAVWPHCERWFVILVWYVLSIGPMFWSWHEAMNEGGTFLEVFYRPLAFACQNEYISRAVNAYIDLWIL